jgi:hypothetical protein
MRGLSEKALFYLMKNNDGFQEESHKKMAGHRFR